MHRRPCEDLCASPVDAVSIMTLKASFDDKRRSVGVLLPQIFGNLIFMNLFILTSYMYIF